ncbi:MAG: hypothetical protein Q3966_08295 [Neisseria sp.]|nr:hypothetical protein [Neisseria sp.]
MKTHIAALALTAVLAAPAFAAEDAPAADSGRETFCKLMAVISHDAVLGWLNGEKRADLQRKMEKRLAPAAKDEETRAELNRQISRTLDGVYANKRDARLLKSEYKDVAVAVGQGEFKNCMSAPSN